MDVIHNNIFIGSVHYPGKYEPTGPEGYFLRMENYIKFYFMGECTNEIIMMLAS